MATKLYCIIGNPVEHSLSPAMHNAAFNALNLEAVYMTFAPISAESGMKALRELNIAGASVTIPFKVDVIPYTDELDESAADTGAVNTLVNRDGRIKGFNTDGIGAIKALRNAGVNTRKSSFLIIGTGGGAKAIAWALADQGNHVTIASRSSEKAYALAGEINKKHLDADWILLTDITPSYTKSFDVIINATPVGMEPNQNESPIEPSLLHKGQWIFDIVYKPNITKFLASGEEKGLRTVMGIDMLLYQGMEQFELWTGLKPPEDVMRKALSLFSGNGRG